MTDQGTIYPKVKVLLDPLTNPQRREGVYWVPPTMPIVDVVGVMEPLGVSGIAVAIDTPEGGPLPCGFFSLKDSGKACVKPGWDPNAPVSILMSRTLVTTTPETPIHEAYALMKEKGVKHLLVVQGASFLGTVSISDVADLYNRALVGSLAGALGAIWKQDLSLGAT